jgi:hypothetical protein
MSKALPILTIYSGESPEASPHALPLRFASLRSQNTLMKVGVFFESHISSNQKKIPKQVRYFLLAERGGFEPPKGLTLYRFSKPAH